VNIPILHHVAAEKPSATQPNVGVTLYYYPNTTSHLFATSFQPQFSYTNEAVSHTRNLTFLKKIMGAPYFDLESIWDEHTYYEFADRSVEHTMSTMVAEPYVNHIPTVRNTLRSGHCTNIFEVNRRYWARFTDRFLSSSLHFQ
jgi:carboxymethylenebutenolidase